MQEDPIDFDLRIDDRNKLLFLLKNVSHSVYSAKKFDCDHFSEYECHHSHTATNFDYSTKKCTFCQFSDLVRTQNPTVKLGNDFLKTFTLNQAQLSSNSRYYFFNVRYTKNARLAEKSLEWSEFQPFKTPHALLAFAECSSQTDLYKAVKNYSLEKEKFKKYAVATRLFIDFHGKHENSEEFQTSLKLNKKFGTQSSFANLRSTFSVDETDPNVSENSTNQFQTSIDLANVEPVSLPEPIEDAKLNNSDFGEINFDLGLNNSENLLLKRQQSMNVLKMAVSVEDQDYFDEAELNSKLKQLESEIVYLDFLFAKEGVDKIAAIVESEKAKIDTCVKSCVSVIVKDLAEKIVSLDTENDRQINSYSDVLKSPVETRGRSAKTTQSTVSSSQMLSIKVINKKLIVARMHKQKADLYLLLNAVNSAVYHYYQAYSLGKKEEDSVWLTSALDGLCSASYLYVSENNRAKQNAFTSSNECKFEFKRSLFELKLCIFGITYRTNPPCENEL
jgi:hypothetical protein